MENAWLIIISAVVSGLLATIITVCVNKREAKMAEKRKVLSILLSYRYEIANQENVNAMNRIQAVFYEDEDVLYAWKDFNNVTKDRNRQNEIVDKYLKLLENMSKASGYKRLKWDDIKTYYFPDGLSKKILEESIIRSNAAQSADSQNRNTGNINSQASMMIIMEMMKQPNGVENLMKLVEMAKQKD